MKHLIALSFFLIGFLSGQPLNAEPTYGIAMQGKLALPADFKHLPYANPNAPKGGIYRRAIAARSFDSLNPFIIKGSAAAGLRGFVFESLLARNYAEPFSLYGLIAEKIEVPDDRTSITFFINPKAKFSDGSPITTADVQFSYQILREKGRPNHRGYYKKVSKVTVKDDHTITFHLDGSDRELPLILGLMPVVSKTFFETRDFTKTTLKPILGSGPYLISRVKPGETIQYRRNKDYWGKDLPITKGLWNFDEVRFEYFRDSQSAFEAFKKHLVDTRYESDAGKWSTAYNFEAAKNGGVIKDTIEIKLPKPTSAFVFNTRREVFADVRVREALAMVFDFEWANKNLLYGLFKRTQGFYTGSVLSSIGRPASVLEKQLLAKVGAKLEQRFLDGSFKQPVSDGTGRDRKQLRKAVMLLAKAGWKFKNRQLVNVKTGKPMEFELLIQTSAQEKIALHYKRILHQIGIAMNVRNVESSQFQSRLINYDFDMVPFTWYNSLSPGNEQAFYWGSKGRKDKGTRNYMGVASPAIDQMVDEMVKAPSPEAFVASVRAIDRLLVSGFYIVPLYYANGQWVARWSEIQRPDVFSNYGFRPETAWYKGK
jgi:peptide/nickel transport system substrate-binding protein